MSETPTTGRGALAALLGAATDIGAVVGVALVGLQYGPRLWGYALAAVLVVALALVWGNLGAPNAPRRLAQPARTVLTVSLLAVATVALALTVGTVLALSFGLLAAVRVTLGYVAD